jgi:sterol desaturase/sphingolipid hydroxylase (fatty acid hydroxylase superfamily)
LLLVLFDLLFYVDHRVHHMVRAGWASHVVHHSSKHFNLATAVRQPWTPFSSTLFFAPLPLIGFPPAAVALMSAIDLLYQFWIHTERIDTLPRPVEFIFNTPSHHRAHHGSDRIYLDRNYGGVLIVWDRLFGTFQPERARPTYGSWATSRASTRSRSRSTSGPRSAATCAAPPPGATAWGTSSDLRDGSLDPALVRRRPRGRTRPRPTTAGAKRTSAGRR